MSQKGKIVDGNGSYDNKKQIYKSFGTVLRNNAIVNEESKRLETISNLLDIPIPKDFDGRKVWNDFISTDVASQGSCGNCWSYATINMLSDRFEIQSAGKIRFNAGLSKILPTICEYQSDINWKELKDNETLQEQARSKGHSTSACNGNSLYNALTYLYRYGTTVESCIPPKNYDSWCLELKPKACSALGDYKSDADLPTCEALLGPDYDECMDGITAVKRFRAVAIYNVPPDEKSIMYEIYRFGTVACGFTVFQDFMSWDGKKPEIYTHWDKRSKSLGAHAVSLVGYGSKIVDGQNIDYWIAENSWSDKWGQNGFFYIQRNIPELELEKNVVALIPDIPYLIENEKCYPEQVKYIENSKSDTLREEFNVNPENCYREITIEKIKAGKLKGDLKPIISKKDVPDFCQFVAGHLNESGKIKHPNDIYSVNNLEMSGIHFHISKPVLILIIIVIFIILFLLLKNRKQN
jgi:hypothetical protein